MIIDYFLIMITIIYLWHLDSKKNTTFIDVSSIAEPGLRMDAEVESFRNHLLRLGTRSS